MSENPPERGEEWDHDAVEPVLRVLFQAGIAVSPAVVSANLREMLDDPPTPEAVRGAVEELAATGYARSVGDADRYYVVTDPGRTYVEEEFEERAFGYVD